MQASCLPTRALIACGCLLVAPATARAQFATSVVDYSPGPLGASESMVTDNILGGPVGAGIGSGSTDVLSLGEGGSVTLAFDVTITDGPGVDFTVFENGFLFEFGGPKGNFAEVAFVEVSTDGVSFARLPSHYVGVQDPDDFTAMPLGTYANMAGGQPVVSNVFLPSTPSPFEPALSGGDAFDLAAAAQDPLVLSGMVDLTEIHFVRLVDAPSDGSSTDSKGTNVWDSRNTTAPNSSDIDAVAVLQHTGTVSPDQPEVALFLDGLGHLNLSISDPNGASDLDMSTFIGSFSFGRAGRMRLANLFAEVTNLPNGVLLRTDFALPGSGLMGALTISIRDFAGNFSADQILLQG